MEVLALFTSISLIFNAGNMVDWRNSILGTITLVSLISQGYAMSVNSTSSSKAPAATGYKRTAELPVIGTTKSYQVDKSESEAELATGDLIQASRFATPIWPSMPVQITSSYRRQIEHDTRIGVAEQHTVMSQGLAYIGANRESSLQTLPHLNISGGAATLYQTSRLIQPSVVLPSLDRSIKPTPTYAPHLFTIAASPGIYTESGVDSFTLSPIIITTTTSSGSTLEALPTSLLPRHLQTAQNWRTSSLHSDASLLPMPTVAVSSQAWNNHKDLITIDSIMALPTSTIQPSPSDADFINGGELSTSSLISKLSRTSLRPKSSPASGYDPPATMPPPTHAQVSSHQTTITPSLKSSEPEWFKELSHTSQPPAGILLHGSTEYYHTQTVTDMAPTEPGQISNNNDDNDDDDEQSLRPAMTPSPSIIMESSTSYWNWSHRIPVNASNTTMNKDGLSAPNKLLVVSVMVILGCFAVTALALRIGNRIIKMRKKGNRKSCLTYLRNICPKRNKQPRPKPMKVTVRMTRQASKKSSVKSISSHQSSIRTVTSTTSGQSDKSTTSILRQSKSLANLNSTDQPSTSTGGETHSVKRSRTMDALLDIGVFSSDFGPENLLESSSEATLLCKDTKKRTRFMDEVYDNPLMKISMDESTGETSASFGSQNELQLFMDRPDSKDNLSDCHASPPRSSNNSPICIISHGKSDFDTPQDSPYNSDKSLENSETESQNDAFRRFQLGKCLKWRALQQRCSSKDSGYVTTPTSPCQDGELLPMQDFKLVDETDNDDKEVAGIAIPAKRRDSFDSPANSSPSSVYPLSSIEESPPPKSRCERCDSLYLASDDNDNSYYSHDGRIQMHPAQRTTWTQNISGLLRDTLANYLYSADRQQYEDGYNSDQYHADYTYPYPEYTQEIPQYNENQENSPPSPSLLKKFFKKKTTTISTQTSGPPLGKGNRRSTVNWHRENGTYMIKPREDAGMEFMGPIYLAKSVEDLGPFLSGSVMDNDLGNSSV